MFKFLVFDSGSSASKLMFADLKNVKNTIETSEIYKINNRMLYALNRLHMSLKIKKYIDLPFKGVWNRFNYLESIYNTEDTFVLVFTNVSIKKIYWKYLEKIKDRNNVKIVLVAVDSFVDLELSALPYIQKYKFDLVYSFDKNDCLKYNLRHTVSLYSKRSDICLDNENFDLFWIGRAKDRLNLILKIAEKADSVGLKYNFYILGVQEKQRIKKKGVFYIDKVIEYDRVLSKVLAARCLLDINQSGQCGMTMRVYEAIFYDKYLITNNPTVRSLKYYDDKYIKLIDNLQEIDFSFLTDFKPVNFNYAGEYSPICFLDRVKYDLMLEEKV